MKTAFLFVASALISTAALAAHRDPLPEASSLTAALGGKTMACSDVKTRQQLFTVRADARERDGFAVTGANDFPADSVIDTHAGDDQLMVKLALDADEQSFVLYIDNPKGNYNWTSCAQGALLKIDGEPDVGSSALSMQTVNCCLQ